MKTDVVRCAEGGLLMFWCPGCDEAHGPRISGERPGALWTWNGDRERPTIQPSILVRGFVRVTDDQHARIMSGEKVEPVPFVCHSFVTDGQIQFLGDCTHALAGKTVPIPEWPE